MINYQYLSDFGPASYSLSNGEIVGWIHFCHCVAEIGMTSKFKGDLNLELIDAATNSDFEYARKLLKKGAIIDKGDCGYGWTALLFAIANDQLKMARYLVKQGASVNKSSNRGQSPLHIAVKHAEFSRYLLEKGADRDKAMNDGTTPLHNAAQYGFLATVMLLMSYGADLNARDIIGRLPIDVACTEEIKQAIRDEPRRRMDEAPGKRATEEDRHPTAATSASAYQEGVDENEEEDEQSNKRPRLDEGAAVAEDEAKVAEEDEDSEPSSDEGE